MKLRKTSIIGFMTVLSLFIFMACNTDKQGNTDNTTAPTEKKAISNENAEVKVHTVVIENMQFNPQELVINKGDKVIWVNKGIVVHDVSEYPDKSWTSGDIEIGDSYEMTPETELNYFCSIHPTMQGTVKFRK